MGKVSIYFDGLPSAKETLVAGPLTSHSFVENPFEVYLKLKNNLIENQCLFLLSHRYRILLGVSVYSWVTIPFTTANLVLQPLFPICMPQVH